MGLIQSRQLQTAIKSDGIHKIKKAAFTQLAIQNLQLQKQALKQYIEAVLEQKLLLQTEYIYQQKDLCGLMLNTKINEISQQDPDLIDRLQIKRMQSFKQITGYKNVIESLEKIKNKMIKGWNGQTVKFLAEVQMGSQEVKKKLLTETPLTPALDKLQPQLRHKALSRFVDDNAYDIQKDGYMDRAIEQLDKLVDFDNVLQDRFSDQNLKQEVTRIVQSFRQSLEESEFTEEGCLCSLVSR